MLPTHPPDPTRHPDAPYRLTVSAPYFIDNGPTLTRNDGERSPYIVIATVTQMRPARRTRTLSLPGTPSSRLCNCVLQTLKGPPPPPQLLVYAHGGEVG